MKLTYIYHSGYAIETDNVVIVIDFYKDSENKVVYNDILNKNKRLYVLSTHSHYDHFNPDILKWKMIHSDIIYIFSKDILLHRKAKARDAIYLDRLDSYQDDVLKIRAYGSTDLGVSFHIQLNDKNIFHAGDLNNWHWNEESTNEEIKEAEDFYQKELGLVSMDIKYLDLAMFPIDPRLGKDYMKGAEQFINVIQTHLFAPMHFDNAYDKAAAFSQYAVLKDCKCICWSHTGEKIIF